MTCTSTHRRAAAAHAAALALALCPAAALAGPLRVVTTTPAYADIVRQVGGEHVVVESVMRGPENVHNVQARPSHMMKLKQADLFVHGGLDAEAWAPLLIKGARNPRLLPGQPGNVDVSLGITLKEVPAPGGLTRALGDIHAFGNTHYVLDPLNGVIIARTIADALKRADPAHADEFERRCADYARRLEALTARLQAALAPYRGAPVVVYHRTWPYFLDRFGLIPVAEVEPKPGISPGPQHLAACVEAMKAHQARIVIFETFSSRSDAESVAQRAGGKAVELAQEVAAIEGVDTYEKLFEYNVGALIAAFQELAAQPGAGAAPDDVSAPPPAGP